MKYLSLSLIAFAFLALSSCGPKPSYTVAKFKMGSVFTLPTGTTAQADDGSLRIVFNAISEDSRCPEGTNCMWAGEAVANITVSNSEGSETFNFKLQGKGDKPATKKFKGYTVNLVQITPYPKSGKKIEKQEYSAQIRVLK